LTLINHEVHRFLGFLEQIQQPLFKRSPPIGVLLSLSPMLIYLLPLLSVIAGYMIVRSWRDRVVRKRVLEADAANLREPPTLHPMIDPAKCLGCGACVNACPEGDVLGLVNGKSLLIQGANCIGHGACKSACPFDAIELVFGTAKRGVSIPALTDEFETTVPGVFVAGELGGMGLIKNAITQGVQAVSGVKRYLNAHPHDGKGVDLCIVGAGPAGMAAALEAKARGLSSIILEQADSLGGTVANFPRRKIVMTAPVELPLVGKVRFKETQKERLIELWNTIFQEHDLQVRFEQKMESIDVMSHGFRLITSQGEFFARSVLLAMGRRGSPRKLCVEGEHHHKVVYRLIDPADYQNDNVLVVGGGDSAIEAACSIAEINPGRVTLAYRGANFTRAKLKNRDKAHALSEQKHLSIRFESEVSKITQDAVFLVCKDEETELKNDAVIVCVGGVLPTKILQSVGVSVEMKYGTP
jgi:thioredoxin reductase/Pyruvate/2-oxoacid:ferredoxin oxidoreductase delta subunit